MTAPDDRARAVAEAAYRDEWGQVVATVIGMTGDWDLAEDCAQDAFAAALATWPRDGVPRRPGAWLTTALPLAASTATGNSPSRSIWTSAADRSATSSTP